MLKNITKPHTTIGVLFGLLFFSLGLRAQIDYSAEWEDFYSYTNAKGMVKNGSILYAIVDNAAFSFDEETNEMEKFSSVTGLSGEITSAVHYSAATSSFVIGYESGLFEIVASNGSINRVVDIVLSDVSSQKKINSMYENEGNLYLSTAFGIVVYDLEQKEFVDTFFVGANSSLVDIKSIFIFDGTLYAASAKGIYSAPLSEGLNDSNNWTHFSSEPYNNLRLFNGDLLVSTDSRIFRVVNPSTLELKLTMSSEIVDLHSDSTRLIVGTSSKTEVFDSNYSLLQSLSTASNAVHIDNDKLYLCTSNKGVLTSQLSSPSSFTEIHPEGPLNNEPFSISVLNKDLWIVYGGITPWYTFLAKKMGSTHYNGTTWTQIPYNSAFPARDITHASIDPNHPNRAYLSSYLSGILVVEDDQPVQLLNGSNSGLTPWRYDVNSFLIARTLFDEEGDLWVANSWAKDSKHLNKMEDNATVMEVGFSSNVGEELTGINDISKDKYNNVYMGTRLGVLLFNEENNTTAIINTETSKGKLPDTNVYAVETDKNQRVWIGTEQGGLVVFDDMENVYSGNFQETTRHIIVDDGIQKELLGSARINDIYIDGADNKWFATHSGGVVHTDSNAQKTLHLFNKDNSPLPSNEIAEIQMDESTGKVFFLTSRGIVAYKSNIASHGSELSEVYGYPNPALRQHKDVAIVGKDGKNLPFGTNVKILDVAGNLVFESNTVQEQSPYGGKIVWDKTNLAGAQVASGVYIVLLFNEANVQTSSTKIAIIN